MLTESLRCKAKNTKQASALVQPVQSTPECINSISDQSNARVDADTSPVKDQVHDLFADRVMSASEVVGLGNRWSASPQLETCR